MATILSGDHSSAMSIGTFGDRIRQSLNVILSIAQIATISWTFLVNTSFSFETRPAYEPPILPAGYTFAVWFAIYGGALVYAIYQALPAQRTNPLLRRIGWWTVAAFAATSLWAIPAGLNMVWGTVPLMFTMFATLLGAFIGFSRVNTPASRTERLVVVLPLSIFIGYVTVATIANTASALAQSGMSNLAGVSPTLWAAGMLGVAGLIASFLTHWSRPNLGYPLTIIWALIGIVVANVLERPNPAVAISAGVMAVLVGLVAVRSQLVTRTLSGHSTLERN